MLKIRLKRVGRKHDPSFRIVVTEKHLGPKSGNYIENVGFYNVLKGDKQVDGERIKHWISKGAQVSPTVHNLLVTEGVITGKKINVLPKKKPIAKEASAEEKVSAPVQTAPVAEEVVIDESVAEEVVAEAPAIEEVAESVSPNPADGQEETPVEEPKTE